MRQTKAQLQRHLELALEVISRVPDAENLYLTILEMGLAEMMVADWLKKTGQPPERIADCHPPSTDCH